MNRSELSNSEIVWKNRLCGGGTINSTSHLPGFGNCGMIRPFQYRKLTREDVYRSHLFEAVASRRGLGGDKRICVLPQMAISVWMPMRPIVSDQVCNSLGSDVSCILRPDEGGTTH